LAKRKLSVLKNKATCLSNSEKKTVFSVLILYVVSSFLLVITFAYTYYQFELHQYEAEVVKDLESQNSILYDDLKSLHSNISTQNIQYPRYENIQSAIYDVDRNLIFSTFENNLKIDFDKRINTIDGFTYIIVEKNPYYLGAAYYVTGKQTMINTNEILRKIIVPTIVILIIILLTSVFLVKLILKPIRDSLSLLDRFIKDTTHELNTPIATILGNIELLENKQIDTSIQKKINRIKSASLTISNLYEDLVYLKLNHNTKADNQAKNRLLSFTF
jgi:two-component system OmpR family sensor kinase